MTELAVLGWFCALALRAWLEPSDKLPPPATARPWCAPAWCGEVIGCHWERPDDHEVHYAPGAVHLCNSMCVHEPPEER